MSRLKLFPDETLLTVACELIYLSKYFSLYEILRKYFLRRIDDACNWVFFQATTPIERGQIIRNLSLLVFRVSEEKRRVLKGSRPRAKGRDQRGKGGLVAPEVADRLEEDERARFKEASIKNNNVITF